MYKEKQFMKLVYLGIWCLYIVLYSYSLCNFSVLIDKGNIYRVIPTNARTQINDGEYMPNQSLFHTRYIGRIQDNIYEEGYEMSLEIYLRHKNHSNFVYKTSQKLLNEKCIFGTIQNCTPFNKLIKNTFVSDKIQNNMLVNKQDPRLLHVKLICSKNGTIHSSEHGVLKLIIGTNEKKNNWSKKAYIICHSKYIDNLKNKCIMFVYKTLHYNNKNISVHEADHKVLDIKISFDENTNWGIGIDIVDNIEFHTTCLTAQNLEHILDRKHFTVTNKKNSKQRLSQRRFHDTFRSDKIKKYAARKVSRISYLFHSVAAEENVPFLAWIVGPEGKTCLASVISYRWIITSGVCIDLNAKPGMYKVFAGFNKDGNSEERLLIEVHHRIWDRPIDGFRYHDIATSIALAKTDHAWDDRYVKGINLRKEMMKSHINHHTCQIWSFASYYFPVLRSGSVHVDENNLPVDFTQRYISVTGVRTANECTTLYGIKYDREVCVQYSEGKTDITNLCQGDSGAPLICQNELIGIYMIKNSRMICQRVRDVFADVGSVYSWIRSMVAVPSHQRFLYVRSDVPTTCVSTSVVLSFLIVSIILQL